MVNFQSLCDDTDSFVLYYLNFKIIKTEKLYSIYIYIVVILIYHFFMIIILTLRHDYD